MQDPKVSGPGGAGCLFRLYWMLFGNAIMWFLLAFIVAKRPKLLSAFDAVYWLIVVSLVVARYVDIRYHKGRTAYGDDPATLKHWRRYAVLLVIAAFGGWVGAHVLGRLLS
jgi:hypothetical protein